MSRVVQSDTTEVLGYFHDKLHRHFLALKDQRSRLSPVPPVFALDVLSGDVG